MLKKLAKFATGVALAVVAITCTSTLAETNYVMPTASSYPAIRTTGKSVSDFVPKYWKIVQRASGDLNGDGVPDTALALQGDYAKFKQKNEGLGTDPYNSNPRMLVVLFKNSKLNDYRLAERHNTIIPIPIPVQEEPLAGIQIRNGILQLDVGEFMSAGSWSASDSTYKFQYQDGRFVLVGADRKDLQRNSGETTNLSYNFLTNKIKITSGNIQDDNDSKVRWQKLRPRKFKTMGSFKSLYEWQVAPDKYL